MVSGKYSKGRNNINSGLRGYFPREHSGNKRESRQFLGSSKHTVRKMRRESRELLETGKDEVKNSGNKAGNLGEFLGWGKNTLEE